MTSLQAGTNQEKKITHWGNAGSLSLEAEPYINEDGVLMVAAEDFHNAMRIWKTRREIYLEEEKRIIGVDVENELIWDEKSQKIKLEVPWRMMDHFYAGYVQLAWEPMQEGDTLELWEITHQDKDGTLMRPAKFFIEMRVGGNIWSYRGLRYIARTNCEWKNGRIYLPFKDIHQTMLPYSQYHWDAESKTLVIVEGYRG